MLSQSKTTLAKRLVNSSALWTVSFLVLLDLTLTFLNPLQYIQNFNYLPLSRNPLVSKIPLFLHSRANPEILIMGCSLPQVSIANYDAERFKTVDATNIQLIRQYTKALYLEELLAKKGIKNQRIFNLTSAGAMASDADLILEKSLEFGKHPKCVILGIGPRTFFDNTYPEITPVVELLEKHRSIKDLAKTDLSLEERREIILDRLWSFYRDKTDYRNFLVKYACYKVHREPTIYLAQQKAAAEKAMKGVPRSKERTTNATSACNATSAKTWSSKTANRHPCPKEFEADLALYNMRYNPPNYKRFETEVSGLKRLLQRCQKEGIKILIVDMPRTEENEALIEKNLLKRYKEEIQAISKGFDTASYLNLNDGKTCSIEDYIDSVHCNASGGKKVQNRLVEHIAGSQWM